MAMLLVLLFALTLSANLSTGSEVPVLFFSPHRSLADLPQTHIGSTIDGARFQDNYLLPLIKDGGNLVIFLQDKLNLEDFSKFADVYNQDSDGGAFKNIKRFMEEHSSLDLPAVKDVPASLKTLLSSDGMVHHIDSLSELQNLNLEKKFFLIFNLPSTSDTGDEEKAFSQNDELIKEAIHQLNKRSVKYTALYTGRSSERKIGGSVRSGRHLLSATSNTGNGSHFFSNISGYLYMESLNVTLYQLVENKIKDPFSLAVKFDDLKSDPVIITSESNSTVEIDIVFDNVTINGTGQMYRIMLNITASNSTMDWAMTDMIIQVQNLTDGYDHISDVSNATHLDVSMIKVPYIYSYSCFRSVFVENDTQSINNSLRVQLAMNRFQFQPFWIYHNRFSDSWDCIGFFTNGIWMGLFPLGLLLLITYFGIIMMTNLSTMDRFDDPKGKTISVNTAEG